MTDLFQRARFLSTRASIVAIFVTLAAGGISHAMKRHRDEASVPSAKRARTEMAHLALHDFLDKDLFDRYEEVSTSSLQKYIVGHSALSPEQRDLMIQDMHYTAMVVFADLFIDHENLFVPTDRTSKALDFKTIRAGSRIHNTVRNHWQQTWKDMLGTQPTLRMPEHFLDYDAAAETLASGGVTSTWQIWVCNFFYSQLDLESAAIGAEEWISSLPDPTNFKAALEYLAEQMLPKLQHVCPWDPDATYRTLMLGQIVNRLAETQFTCTTAIWQEIYRLVTLTFALKLDAIHTAWDRQPAPAPTELTEPMPAAGLLNTVYQHLRSWLGSGTTASEQA